MPAALALSDESIDDLDAFAAALEAVGLKAWRSTLGAARTFQGRVEGAGGWERVNLDTQLEWMRRARPSYADASPPNGPERVPALLSTLCNRLRA